MDQSLCHVGVIPDGNRRWAKNWLSRLRAWVRRKNIEYGHRQGAETFRRIAGEVLRLQIAYLTVWACSSENLKERSSAEVEFLHGVLEQAFTELANSEYIHENKVRVRAIGRWREEDLVPLRLQKAIETCMEATSGYDEFLLTVLVAYSGVDERQDTEKRIIADQHRPLVIDAEYEKRQSWLGDIPDADLIIRTGIDGDPHNSEAFLPFHSANSQLRFLKTYWPALSVREFRKVVKSFYRTERRFGR